MMDSAQEESKERPFICPCGKKYLSYPALFTHIKQKHQGIAPGQVIRPKAANKRGRPRKNPSDPLYDTYSSEHKNPLERYLGGENEEANYQNLVKEAQKIKKQLRTSFDFRPPITFSHILPKPEPSPQQKDPTLIKTQFKGETPHPYLQQKLKNIFQTYSTQDGFLDTQQLNQLISANKFYLFQRETERCRSRRPIGIDQWQMELRTALLQFLDWAQTTLTLWHYKNIELLVGLLITFFTKMVADPRPFTTVSYVPYLNLFTKNLLIQTRQDGFYSRALSIQNQIPLKLLAAIHEWFVLERLSFHQVTINPSFITNQEKNDGFYHLGKNTQHL